MNIVIPMAGRGSRFSNAEYGIPKPLIMVGQKPMVQWAIESFGVDGQYIFVVQEDHVKSYDLDVLLKSIVSNPIIIPINYITEGQACSVLLAKEYINNNDPIVSTNCDQVTDWDVHSFLELAKEDIDGIIPVYRDTGPKWSYARLDEEGFVIQTAEKVQISEWATVGTYYWREGKKLVDCTESMIKKNKRVNNEFYSCPVYNEGIELGMKFKTFLISKMYPVGTPEDLNRFLNSSFYKNHKWRQ